MVDFILNLIDFNEGIDYTVVSKIILIYLALLWIFVSIWVFNDAKYRFNNTWIALSLAVLNLFLSFPFLLIYLLIRPSHREDWEDGLDSDGGIHVPVVNFTGDDGVVISLQLRINSKKLTDKDSEYKLDISLNKEGEEADSFLVSEKKQITTEQKPGFREKLKKALFKKEKAEPKKQVNILTRIKNKLWVSTTEDAPVASVAEGITETVTTFPETEAAKSESKPKRKNKRKRRKKK